jgi:uncharacterized membrane protein
LTADSPKPIAKQLQILIDSIQSVSINIDFGTFGLEPNLLQMIILSASDWALFLGRFHPVLVHLPIGFLLIAALLEVGRWWGKIEVQRGVVSFILFWSAVSATVACGAGYLLSLGGGYDEHLLDEHKWQGIWVAIAAWVAWVAKSDWFANHLPISSLLYVPALVIGSFFVFVAGHHGGALTHGETYLTQETPQPLRNWLGIPPKSEKNTETLADINPITDLSQALVYDDVVKPIFKSRCMQCHNATKSKGDLRMDEVALLKKGGEHGVIFVAGKSADSEILKRCLLPLEDEEHMPPKGKNQLSDNQISILKWWIDQGASFDKKVTDLPADNDIKPILAALATGVAAAAAVSQTTTLPTTAPVPDATDIETLKKAGLLVVAISKENPNLLEVNAVNAAGIGDKEIALLKPLRQNIIWLKIGHTKITNAAMGEIIQLKNLQKLHLENTAITNEALKSLKELPNLTYLNLVGTHITDAGVGDVSAAKHLTHVYTWNTELTVAGIERLKTALPHAQIESGVSAKDVAAFVKLGDKAPQPEVPKETKK